MTPSRGWIMTDSVAGKPSCPNCGSVWSLIGERLSDGARRWVCPCGAEFSTAIRAESQERAGSEAVPDA